MNLSELRDEIALPTYQGQTDQQIATAINAKMVTRPSGGNMEVKKHAIENGYWPMIVLASRSDVVEIAHWQLAQKTGSTTRLERFAPSTFLCQQPSI